MRRENNPSSHIANEDPNKSRRTMAQSCRHFEEYTTLGIIPHVRVLGSFSRKRTNNNTQGEKNTTRKERKSMSITFPHFFFVFRKNSSSEPLPSSYSRNSLSRTKHARTNNTTHTLTPQRRSKRFLVLLPVFRLRASLHSTTTNSSFTSSDPVGRQWPCRPWPHAPPRLRC